MGDIGAADYAVRLEVFLKSLGAGRSSAAAESESTQGSGRVADFDEADDAGQGDKLRALRASAEADGIPIIRPATERYLRTQLTIKHPRRILEVGAAVGYSAIMMAGCCPEADITTIENYAPRIEAAKRNISDFGFDGRIRLIEADAEGALRELSESGEQYDFIFLDAAKGQYIALLPYIDRLLCCGGVLITDNCLQDGSVIDSRYAVRRRDRTIHRRMREYLSALWADENYLCDLLPIGDGVAVAVKHS